MIRWKQAAEFIEKNGLVIIAVAIILVYWIIDIITVGRLVSRFLITFSLLSYGVFTQYLINAHKAAKDTLQESEKMHRLMIESLPLAVFVETRGKIVYVNPALLTLLKASSADEVTGMRLIDFVSPGLYDVVESRRRAMIEERRAVSPLEMNFQCKDGTSVTVVTAPIPIVFQEQPAILTALYDVTERKKKEIELQKANKLLQIYSEEMKDMQARLKEQAIRDPLTGLFNRRYLQETIGRELSRASREKFQIGIVIIDIDRFKQINDAHGHKVGDLILQSLGNILHSRTRAEDIACRYGGDEFLLVLPKTTQATTSQRAEQWRANFEALKTADGEKVIQTTISLGVAVYPRDGGTMEAVINAADQAMYRGKASGGNRVVLA